MTMFRGRFSCCVQGQIFLLNLFNKALVIGIEFIGFNGAIPLFI